jgi:acetylornithine deacetylase/succinyl-diaminopimelate desuccinylase-like protein
MNPLDKVLAHLDPSEVVDLALELGSIDSPSGEEHTVGDHLERWCRTEGFTTRRLRYDEHHAGNVLGINPGSGGGPSLLFNSHMDTVVRSGDSTYFADPDDPVLHRAWQEDDRLLGVGLVNDKGPMAAWLVAAAAIRRSGVQLAGDLVLTMVTGEIGHEPVDEFQGPRWHGKDLGTRYVATHGGVADFALVAETTNFRPVWTEAGKAFLKVTVDGRANGVYTPYLQRPTAIEDEPNAIVHAARLIPAIEQWALGWEQRNTIITPGGVVSPTVNIGAIRAGHPTQPIMTPASCRLYLDVRLPPGATPLVAQAEVRQLLTDCGIAGTVEIYLFRRGYVAEGAEPLIDAVVEATSVEVPVLPPTPERPVSSSMWRDLNIFNEMGIPSITFGPGGGSGGGNRGLGVDDLVSAARIYARTALRICGVS